MLSGLSNLLFGSQRKDDAKKKPVSSSELDHKGEWLLVNNSGDTVAIDTVLATDADVFPTEDDTSLLEDTLTEEYLPTGHPLTVDITNLVALDNILCSNSTLSTPAKSDTSSDEVSDFERYRGPYVSMRDLESHSDTGLSDVSSLPEHVSHPSMDEEWLVTPPPCFTSASGHRGSSSVERPDASSLENLLIEHPSMSVYYPLSSGRLQTSPIRSVMTDSLQSNSTDVLSSSENDSFVEEDNFRSRRPSSVEMRVELPGVVIAQRVGVPRPIHHQPENDLLGVSAEGGVAVAVNEWKGKTRVARRALSRNALDNNNRVHLHDAQFKLRRQREHARGLPTSRHGKGKF